MKKYWDLAIEIARDLYLSDSIPWVLGFSGGKDSTATLQVVWFMLLSLPPEQRTKDVHVVCTDTLVENPIVAAWAEEGIQAINRAAVEQGLPITGHRLTPALTDSYWVCLIGRGYASPRRTFRWCTERLKINPNKAFIDQQLLGYGSVILVLGTRKAESSARGSRMVRLEGVRKRANLSPSPAQPGALVFSPLEDWSSDEVWLFLMQRKNPWGIDNKMLLTLYSGANADNECPLVVDTGAPSCGSSRFGCWTCTLVGQDQSMDAMIANDLEKEWMLPLLDYRNTYLATERDPVTRVALDNQYREYVRANGRPTLVSSGAPRLTYGPYTQEYRALLLRKLLETEQVVREMGKEISLISMDELREIRRLWVEEKHEVEDLVPKIYQEVTGQEYPDEDLYWPLAEEFDLLRECCSSPEEYRMAREALSVEYSFSLSLRRRGLFEKLESAVSRHGFDGPEDALEYALRRAEE